LQQGYNVLYKGTSLNPVPNAQVCVFYGTHYKITITNYISKTSLYMTFRMYPSGPWLLKILIFALLVTREIACVPSLPIALFAMPCLYSTLSSPHRSKQTMTGQMDDWTDGQMNEMMLHNILYYM